MKNKLLPWIIALSALSVSGSAAFYSVSGLGKMFAGAALQVMVLAGSLEFAKLVTASLLYQYWKKLNIGLKIYLSIATVILVLITSAGIYGFLSSAYQETAFKVQNQDKNIEILDKDISVIQTEIKNYESQINQKTNRLTQLTTIRTNLQTTQDVLIEKSKSTTSVRKQISEIESEIKRMDSEISVMNDSISSKNTRIGEIERNKLGVASNADLAKEVGPLKYLADLTGKSLSEVVNWYIIVLMLVFDPLAIALVIAANFAFERAKDDEEESSERKENKKEKKEMKKLWEKIKGIVKKPVSEEKYEIDNPIELESDSDDVILEEPKQESIKEEIIETVTEELDKLEENKIESVKEENINSTENKEEEKDKYRDSNLSAEKQKMMRERFRNNPGSNPLKLR